MWEPCKYTVLDPRAFDRIGIASDVIRDEHMVRLLAERVSAGERVFAVVGRSHIAVQEPALREVMPEAEFTTVFLDHTWIDR